MLHAEINIFLQYADRGVVFPLKEKPTTTQVGILYYI